MSVDEVKADLQPVQSPSDSIKLLQPPPPQHIMAQFQWVRGNRVHKGISGFICSFTEETEKETIRNECNSWRTEEESMPYREIETASDSKRPWQNNEKTRTTSKSTTPESHWNKEGWIELVNTALEQRTEVCWDWLCWGSGRGCRGSAELTCGQK